MLKISSQDRASLIRLASSLPAGDENRKTILAGLVKTDITASFDEFYVIGYWGNPYSSSDREYFWSGPHDTRRDAQKAGLIRQERGQPKKFIDWAKGVNTVHSGLLKFLLACKKVGLNPRVDGVDGSIDNKIAWARTQDLVEPF
jgi:hypothetical protein